MTNVHEVVLKPMNTSSLFVIIIIILEEQLFSKSKFNINISQHAHYQYLGPMILFKICNLALDIQFSHEEYSQNCWYCDFR